MPKVAVRTERTGTPLLEVLTQRNAESLVNVIAIICDIRRLVGNYKRPRTVGVYPAFDRADITRGVLEDQRTNVVINRNGSGALATHRILARGPNLRSHEQKNMEI